jgi:hypothetical protein
MHPWCWLTEWRSVDTFSSHDKAEPEGKTTVQINAQALTGSTTTMTTKKGESLQKTKLKLIDIGPEAAGGDVYWVDFLGEAALADDELRQIARQSVTVEIRRMYASAGKQMGRAYLNANGGAVLLGGTIVQRGLRS